MTAPTSPELSEQLDWSRQAAISEMKNLVDDKKAQLVLEGVINRDFERKAARLQRLRVRRVKKPVGPALRRGS